MARRASTAKGDVPNLKVFLGQFSEPGLFWPGLRNKILETGIFLIPLGKPLGILSLHADLLLTPARVSLQSHLNDSAEVGNSLALGDQLLSGFELADDPLRRVSDSFHSGDPGPSLPR